MHPNTADARPLFQRPPCAPHLFLNALMNMPLANVTALLQGLPAHDRVKPCWGAIAVATGLFTLYRARGASSAGCENPSDLVAINVVDLLEMHLLFG